MAEVEDVLAQINFSCSVCLDLLKDPVALPCGHSYCMGCIEGCWDQEDHGGVYSCPQCRQTFTPRPVLGRNTMLAEVLEKLNKTELQAAPSDPSYAGPGDVLCDVCIGRKKKAVKSCLMCLVSYCETHLQPHYISSSFKRHRLTDAIGQLQEKICSHHNVVLQVYCHTDQQCICYLCTMDEHKGHDTVSATAGRTEKQKHLEVTQSRFQQRIEQREKEVQELKEAVDSVTRSAQAAVDHTNRIFTEMILAIEEKRTELKEVIKAQKKAAVSQAEELLERLEQEIAELRRRQSDIEILKTEDHVDFLKSFQSLCVPIGSEDLPTITVNPKCSFKEVTKFISELKPQLENICINTLATVSAEVNGLNIVLPLKPKTRDEFLKYKSLVKLDPKTAHEEISLTDENSTASKLNYSRTLDDHPDRFDCCPQVLCREGLTGCCYWEVQWDGELVEIAVAYRGVSRKGKGDDCVFGLNNKSWSLSCSPSSYRFCTNKVKTVVSGPISSTIGVYLDHKAGTLSFYSVSNTMNLLRRVQTTFTEPIYPGFGVGFKSRAKLCSLK